MSKQGGRSDAAPGDGVRPIAAFGGTGAVILLTDALPEVVTSLFAERLVRIRELNNGTPKVNSSFIRSRTTYRKINLNDKFKTDLNGILTDVNPLLPLWPNCVMAITSGLDVETTMLGQPHRATLAA